MPCHVCISELRDPFLSQCLSASGGIILHAGMHTGSGVSREVFPKLPSGQWQCSSSHGYTWIFTIFSFPTDINISCYPCVWSLPEAAAVPEALCSSQVQVPAWACWTSLRKRRLNSVIPCGFPFLPFLVMPTHVRIDSHSYSVGVWGREGKAICLLFLVTKKAPLVHWGKGLVLPTVCSCCHPLQLVFSWNFWLPFPLWGNCELTLASWDKSSSLGLLKTVLQTFTVIYETWPKLGYKKSVSLMVSKSLGQQQEQKFVLHLGLGMWWCDG